MSLDEARKKKDEFYDEVIKQDPKYKNYIYHVAIDHLGRHKDVTKKRYYEHCLVVQLKKGYTKDDITNKELKKKRQFSGLEVIIETNDDE
jgi:hypothetical protein